MDYPKVTVDGSDYPSPAEVLMMLYDSVQDAAAIQGGIFVLSTDVSNL